MMDNVTGKRVLVTGGSRGLGRGLVELFVERGALVTVVARDGSRLRELAQRLGVETIQGDITDERLVQTALREVKPDILVLNAGAAPKMVPLHEQTWESFSEIWNVDVKAGFLWIQEVLRGALPRGSRVLVSSSGAAVQGSVLSGGYAGAKRMLWWMTQYANTVATELDLGVSFQALVLQQLVGETELGRNAASAYARRKGVSLETFLAGFGTPLSPRQYGEQVLAVLTDPKLQSATIVSIKSETGPRSLDGS
jgi:NAD(P)-dependent dehydrogenase (short-subunit alcohol dehydrogenase family)